jgi:gluconokinase
MSLLVIDTGSSSVRVMLYDGQAQPIEGASARRQHAFNPDDEADPVQLRGLIENCIDEVLGHPASGEIEGVGMATFAGNWLGLDAAGQPVTPLYTYADSRGGEVATALRQKIDAAANCQRTGCPIHPAYLPVRLNWLKRTQPDVWSQVEYWADFGAYCFGAWLGRRVTSFCLASWSGIFNRYTLNWDEEWLAALGMEPAAMPDLRDIDVPIRGLSPAYAERWPALQDVPFLAPVADGAAATVGAGAMTGDELVLTIGTTAAVRRVVVGDEPPPVPAGLWAYRIDRRHHLVGGALNEGGNIFAWAERTLRLPEGAETEAALQARRPGQHGLRFTPTLNGERSPGWVGDTSGAIEGLRLTTTPLDILQAALEGVAARLALVANLISTDDLPVIGAGGALVGSPSWARLVALVMGRELRVQQSAESTGRGVVMMVWRALGRGEWGDFGVAIGAVFRPES